MAYIGAGITRFNTADELTVTGDAQIDGTTLVVDSTNNNVGIGTASPDGSSFSGSSSPVVDISGTRPLLILSETDSNTKKAWVGLSGDEFFLGGTNTATRFYTANAEAARIDSSGQIGISGSTASFDTTGSVNGIQLYYETDSGLATVGSYSGGGSTQLTFHTNSGGGASSERMRIDSSGNLLVGGTNVYPADNNIVGHSLTAVGQLQSSVSGYAPFVGNRKSSDGEIATFKKDGTKVGSIGTDNVGDLFIGNDDVGVLFAGGSDYIIPWNPSGPASRDNAISLGDPSHRFKNLELSGSTRSRGTYPVFTGADVLGSTGGITSTGSNPIVIGTDGTERMRIETNNVLFGKTVSASSTNGVSIGIGTNEGFVSATNSGDPVLYLNRQSSDGILAQFRHADTTEGTISISGTTVSYNGGHLSRWSQATDGNRIDGLVKGTVMTNLDQMAEWTKDGVTEDNEQLNCMAVSSVEGDANVAGVFVNWDDDDTDYTADMNIAMTGDMVIRIASGTTVARGDLLMSAGDGTAKPQGDDIVRSKTIAKVTSTNVSHTYDDGSYLVPCVLMAC